MSRQNGKERHALNFASNIIQRQKLAQYMDYVPTSSNEVRISMLILRFTKLNLLEKLKYTCKLVHRRQLK